MSGLISLQIKITGDLEKDQQLLLYGIGGLIGLIVLSMIIIVILVLVRKARRNKEAKREATLQASTAPPQLEFNETEKPTITDVPKAVEEKKIEPKVEAKTTEIEKKVGPVIVPEKPKEEKIVSGEKEDTIVAPEVTKLEEPNVISKKEEPAAKPMDKMEEIRRRLEEIKGQKKDGPTIVLPKIEAAPKVEKIVVEEVLKEPQPNMVSEMETPSEEIDETILVEDTESVAVPIQVSSEDLVAPEEEQSTVPEEEAAAEEALAEEEQPRMIEDEGVMKPVHEIQIEEELAIKEPVNHIVSEPATTHLPNGKFLPMKKLTFAEWVELFK